MSAATLTAAAATPPATATATHLATPGYSACRGFCRLLTTSCFNLRVFDAHHIPATGGALIVANHQSNLDPVLIAAQLRRPVGWMAKSELFEKRWLRALIVFLHAFPVRQGEGDVGAVRETIKRLQEGYLLTIFPEGSRTYTGEMLPLEPGIGLIARRAGVPVIPCAIQGSFQAWRRGTPMFRKHPIRVRYGPPFDLAKLKATQVVSTIDRVLHEMTAALGAEMREEFPWMKLRPPVPPPPATPPAPPSPSPS